MTNPVTQDRIAEVVLSAIRTVSNLEPDHELSLDTKLFGNEELSIDSIGALEMLTIIEGELGIEIDDTQLDFGKLATINDVIETTRAYTDENGSGRE
ncbi:acyl carrier protein [Streptomyces sp. NPDC059629]|uniref:acyl carrier protein n=1 Tax=Streptomyces sp. NPDC059629 TaxID=3346889 RepID=UPI0036B4232E